MPEVKSRLNDYDDFIKSRLPRINRLAQLILRGCNCVDAAGHAGEVVNEVYIKVRNAWERLNSPEDALNTITANAARTHAEKCRRELPTEIDEGATPLYTPPDAKDTPTLYEKAILIEQLLNQLKPLDQLLISLLFQGWTYAEIAELLEVPSGTLRSNYSRAIQQLKQANFPLADATGQDPVVATTD